MDGASIHMHPNITHYLRSVGLVVIFLPPYCPFYNPIEYAFGYVKDRCQKLYTRDNELEIAAQAFQYYMKRPLHHLFEKCGYSPLGFFDPTTNYIE